MNFKNLFKRKAQQRMYSESEVRQHGINMANRMSKSMSYAGFSTGTASNKYHGAVSAGSIVYDHKEGRAKARVVANDSSIVRSIITTHTDTVIADGLRLSASPKANVLGITPEQAEEWASDVDARFDLWCKSKSQHRREQMPFYEAQGLWALQQIRDNDVFVRLYYTKGEGLLNPVQYEFIDADQILGNAFTYTAGVQQNIDGIERDSRGRAIAYNIVTHVVNKNAKHELVKIQAKTRSGRINMIHGFTAEYAGQGRGYSKLTHILNDASSLADFTIATKEKAKSQAVFALFVESTKGDAANFVENQITTPARPNVEPLAGDLTTLPDKDVGMKVLGEVGIESSYGQINALPEGQKVTTASNNTPSTSYESYTGALKSDMTSTVGQPIEVTQKKFAANYSASRAALKMYWDNVRVHRKKTASDLLAPVYEMWLSEEIAAGRVIALGWSDPIMKAAWLNANWIGIPMPNIDPMREAKASEIQAGMGSKTLSQAALDLNGSEYDSNVAKLKKEIEKLPLLPTHPNAKQEGGGN